MRALPLLPCVCPCLLQAGVLSLAPFFMYIKGRHMNAKGGAEGRIRWRTVKHFHRLRLAANNRGGGGGGQAGDDGDGDGGGGAKKDKNMMSGDSENSDSFGGEAAAAAGEQQEKAVRDWYAASGDWVHESVHRFNHEGSDLATANAAPGESTKLDADSAVHHMDGIDGLHLGESIGVLELFGHDQTDGESLSDSHVCKQLENVMTSGLFVSLTL
eukprot:SAG22_NODE_1966_length_3238_cov_1.530424_1_plen_213_part_10